jgi:transposase
MEREGEERDSLRAGGSWGVQTPEDVETMRRLRGLGWGTKRISAELGCSRNTVRRWLAVGSWQPYGRPRRRGALDDFRPWLEERFHRHGGNADVVHQELVAEHGIVVSLRTVERAVAPWRRALAAAARATVRFETPPGRQLQIDFGERRVEIAGEWVRVHLFVATLGYSRRRYVRAFRHERQACWLEGIEGAFHHFGGVPEEVLLDNPRALVLHHDVLTREVRFHERLLAFASYWGFRPRACAPYRARTKGKDERSVGYVKRNAIAGRSFPSWEAFEAHLMQWTREVADVRVHGTTGETPLARFVRDEANALHPLDGKPPFEQTRELVRRVASDCSIEVDTNAYSVPWRLIGESVQVEIAGGHVRIRHAGREVALHDERTGLRRERAVDPAHFEGVAGLRSPVRREIEVEPTLLRPLAEYEQLAGGSF